MNKLLKFKKEEKRLITLLYKKGFLKNFKLSDLYWAKFSPCRNKKRKHGRKHRSTIYYPEVHFCTTDYWGESDEHSLIDEVYPNYEILGFDPENGRTIFKRRTRLQRIKMLKKMSTVINDNKIREVLKVKMDN